MLPELQIPRTIVTRLITRIATMSSVASIMAGSVSAQVVRTEQTSGTKALLIAVSPVNENVAWLSGSGGTWVRTTDGGTTWKTGRVPGADSLQFRDVHALDANNAWVLSIGDGPQSRIYKTSDGGETWTNQFTNDNPKAFYDCMDFWDSKRGIVIGDAIDGKISMLRTDDGGAHWTRVPSEQLPAAQQNEGSFAASGTCLITRKGGHAWIVASNPEHGRLLHTANFGKTWTIDTIPVTTHNGSGPQSVSFADDQHGVVLGGGNNAAVNDTLAAITDDGGKTWKPRARPPLASGVWGGVHVPGAKTRTVVAVGPKGAVYTTDDAVTWTSIDAMNYWSVGFASRNAGWAVGVGGRVTKLSGF